MSETLTESATGLGLLAQIACHTRDISRMMRQFQTAGGADDVAMTIAEAARKANVSATTIRRAIRARNDRDRLAAFDQSSGDGKPTWRIMPADLDAWLRRRPGGAAPPSQPMTRVPPRKSRHFKV